MTVRFLADEDVRAEIIRGMRSREPAIDILDVKNAGLRGAKDDALLEFAAHEDRIIITHDRNTMAGHFYARVAAGRLEPGLSIVPKRPSAVGQVIESLFLVWTASQAEEWRNRII